MSIPPCILTISVLALIVVHERWSFKRSGGPHERPGQEGAGGFTLRVKPPARMLRWEPSGLRDHLPTSSSVPSSTWS